MSDILLSNSKNNKGLALSLTVFLLESNLKVGNKGCGLER